MTRQTVIAWRARYEAGEIAALADLPRSGRPGRCDNYATHNHPNVKAWLAKHPRIKPDAFLAVMRPLELVATVRRRRPGG